MTKVDIYEDVSVIEIAAGGIQGPKGDKGDGAATVTVGTTTTGNAGTNASVTNSGTVNDVVLNFTIPQGIKGDQGDPGTPGINGTNGTNGTNGADGADGDSAYQVAVNNGFVGTEQQWLESLVGETGAQGTPGLPGADGADGVDGAPGAGVIPGGTAGQILAKIDSTDYNTEWVDNDPTISAATPTTLGTVYGKTDQYSFIGSPRNNTAIGNLSINPLTTGIDNTSIGAGSLAIVTNGSHNVSVGTDSLRYLTSGYRNVSIGNTAMNEATTAYSNVVVGDSSGSGIINGYFNTILGSDAYQFSNAVYNTVLGYGAMPVHEIGNENLIAGSYAANNAWKLETSVILGSGAGNNTAGLNNLTSNLILIGTNAEASAMDVSNEITLGNSSISRFRIPGLGIDWTTANIPGSAATPTVLGTVYGKTTAGGTYNVSLGRYSLNAATTTNNNVAIGDSALKFVTNNFSQSNTAIGTNAMLSGLNVMYNTGVGKDVLVSLETGNANTAIGEASLASISSAGGNTAVGASTLTNLSSGDGNTVLGSSAGTNLTSGSNNLIIGYDSEASTVSVSNEITIGNSLNDRLRVPGLGIDVNARTAFLGKPITEKMSENVGTTKPSSTQIFSIADQGSIAYFSGTASNNWIINFKGSSTTNNFDTYLDFGKTITLVMMVTNGATPYYCTGAQVDGTTTAIKWQGGTAPTSGNANSIDIYTFSIYRSPLGGPYLILGSQTKFA